MNRREMFKNQLQELAQRSCFNLPSYSCMREGPDHAPRFKATVNFNGETFESPSFCSTLRQAEHAAAEVALGTLAERGPSKTLAARVLDKTGVYKNLLQETAHRAGLNLPLYTTFRTAQGQVPIFSCTVELAGMSFSGKPARTKKVAQKNAAMAAWSALRTLSQQDSSSSTSSSTSSSLSSPESRGCEEREQVIIARALSRLQPSNLKESIENNQSLRPPKVTHSCSESKNLQHQNCLPSSLTPEINLYPLWQQNYILQQQYCLLGLTLSPPIPPPRIYPFMQSLPRPHHCFHFPIGQDLMSVPSVPKLLVSSSDSTSSVTIQEMQEVKPEESSQPKRQESSQKNDQRENSEVQSKTGNVQLQNSQAELHQWLPAHGSSKFKSKPIDFRLATSSQPSSSSHVARSDPVVISNTSSASLVTTKPRNTISVESLTRLKPGPFSYSARFGYENYDRVGMRPASMAPPVRVRSVVRVCSAPPLRKTPSFNQEGESSNEERKN